MSIVKTDSSASSGTLVFPEDSPIREIRFSKTICPHSLGKYAKLNVFFRDEDLLKQFQPEEIKGLSELDMFGTAKFGQDPEWEAVFFDPKHGPYESLDRAIAHIAENYISPYIALKYSF